MLRLKIRTLVYSPQANSKIHSFSSILTQMKKKKKIQRPSKAVRITKPTRTINKSTTSTAIVVEPKPKSRAKPNSHYQENDEIQPKTSIFSSIFLGKYPILSPDFYQIDAIDLAPRLLGKHLKKDDILLQITEVEAYRTNDSASHVRFGITARTAPAFGPGGHAYVYLCYGLHTMLNVVADKEGIGAGVLIRSCAPVSGLETIQQRRSLNSEKPVLLAGPGKVSQALGISTEWTGHPLFTPGMLSIIFHSTKELCIDYDSGRMAYIGGLELLDGPEPEHILVGPRVGIEYALPEHVNVPWRFAIAGSPWISVPRNSLRHPAP